MRSGKTWRTGLLLVLVAGLLTASELKGAPRVTIQNPTVLYLLAEYKAAMGDAGSGLELLDRALDGRESLPSRPNTLNACNISPAVATP
ncbi:MAG: hypothetical protein ACLP2H_18685 [Terriglobales bacterium]